MVESPQRIWIEADDECPYFYEAHELHDVEQDVIEYVRADLYAALEAQLAERTRVKPLEWEDADEGMCTKWRAAALGGHYELVALDGDDGGLAVNFHWGRPLSFWFIQGDPDEWGPTGPKMFKSLDEAKAAAQADYERRIRSALEPAAPEGRQEVVRIGDAVLDWMVKFDLLDAGNEYCASDVLAVLNDLTPSTRPAEQAVTDEMVEAAISIMFHKHGWFPPRQVVKDALRAAMDVGRRD